MHFHSESSLREPDNSGRLSADNRMERLLALLEEVGLVPARQRQAGHASGFPLVLDTHDGPLVLDLPTPAFFSPFDPEQIGFVVLDHIGFPALRWGRAENDPLFAGQNCLLDSPLSGIVQSAFRGTPSTEFVDGNRYYAAGVPQEGGLDVVIMVADAQSEGQAMREAAKSHKMADALKRVGKALTMNQTLQPLCVAAVHEIASTAELAAVLLWVRTGEDARLELLGSVGANRHGTVLLGTIGAMDSCTCAAELAASQHQEFKLRSVYDNVMTAELEAKFCYLKPGGLCVIPLLIGDKLIGVLELIGRHNDADFFEKYETFHTIAEHLALALNSAIMFESVERMATFDALTGISNHRAMQEFLQRRVSEAQRNHHELGVIMIDVDHFRSFNEEEGHDAGDEVLKKVVEALKLAIRPYDLAARYGGEEFTVIMPGVGEKGTLAVAERIRSRIEQIEFVTRSGRVRHVTASLGCAVFPSNATDPAGLLKAADIALFRAKRAGRNRTEVYSGPFTIEHSAPTIDLAPVFIHFSEEERRSAVEMSQELEPYIAYLAKELSLSVTQASILRALVQLAPRFQREVRAGENALLRTLESAPELRILIPSLHAVDERFDGAGPHGFSGVHIPLLARVLGVLLALADRRGGASLGEPGRFDPEIVGYLSDFQEAA